MTLRWRMSSFKLQVEDDFSGYSASCIANFPDVKSRDTAEEILAISASFSEQLPVSARSGTTPIDRLGEKACGRIIHKIMNGRPVPAVRKYETANIRFEGIALGVVAVVAMEGLGPFETQIAERSIKFLVNLMAGKHPTIQPFSAKSIHPLMNRFFKTHIGAHYQFTAGVSQGLKYIAKKSGDQIRIFSLEPLEERFFNRP